MADPRDSNCKAYAVNAAGLVTGVELTYKENPSTKYALYRVNLVDEVQNGIGGPTVAKYSVLDKNNIPVSERVYMAYPWFNYASYMLPGNPNNEHFVSNKYFPPELGPLAIFVGNEAKQPVSDEIGGFGLPVGHHISFNLIFKERGGTDPVTPPGGDNTNVLAAIAALDAKVKALALHLGLVL
jgi:hypothetical protein